MESIGDVLSRYKKPEEPDEVAAIKRYVQSEFGVAVQVSLQGESALVITVGSGALANTLRMRTPALQIAANTKKRLVFRIG